MRTRLVGILLPLLAAGRVSLVSAQVVRGTVTDSATGRPVAGAGVSLLVRRAALARGIPYTTTLSAAAAAAAGIRSQREEVLRVTSLQEIFGRSRY